MEGWKSIPGYEGFYEVSANGEVRSWRKNGNCTSRKLSPVSLKGSVKQNGYIKVHLRSKNESHHISVHRLVANLFIPNPENKPQVNHKNGIKTDNRACNLEWVTAKENTRHAYDMNLRDNMKGEGHSNSILTKSEVLEIRDLYDQGVFQKQIASRYGIAQQTVSEIVTFKKWKHLKGEVSYRNA